MMPVLCIFEELSRLKINYHKIKIFCFGNVKDLEDEYKILFSMRQGLSHSDNWESLFI
jgi:hypothetical protein